MLTRLVIDALESSQKINKKLATPGAYRDSKLGSLESGVRGRLFSIYPGVLSLLNFGSSVTMKGTAYFFFFNFIATLFIYFFIFGCVGSSVRARAFSSYGKWGPLFITVQGPLFIAVRGPFTIAAPPVAGHRLQTHRLSSCGSRAQLVHGMWDLPRPGLEPVSPALAGRFSTTAPPGKPWLFYF